MQENKFDSIIKFGILNNKQNLLTLCGGEKKFKQVQWNNLILSMDWTEIEHDDIPDP
jgi:hypothetical protein